VPHAFIEIDDGILLGGLERPVHAHAVGEQDGAGAVLDHGGREALGEIRIEGRDARILEVEPACIGKSGVLQEAGIGKRGIGIRQGDRRVARIGEVGQGENSSTAAGMPAPLSRRFNTARMARLPPAESPKMAMRPRRSLRHQRRQNGIDLCLHGVPQHRGRIGVVDRDDAQARCIADEGTQPRHGARAEQREAAAMDVDDGPVILRPAFGRMSSTGTPPMVASVTVAPSVSRTPLFGSSSNLSCASCRVFQAVTSSGAGAVSCLSRRPRGTR